MGNKARNKPKSNFNDLLEGVEQMVTIKKNEKTSQREIKKEAHLQDISARHPDLPTSVTDKIRKQDTRGGRQRVLRDFLRSQE